MPMRTFHRMQATLLAIGILSACTPAMLSRDDRKDVCQVAVLASPGFESPLFEPSPFSQTDGGVVGAMAAGAGWGAFAGTVGFPIIPAWIVTGPIGALYGAAYGAECVAAGRSHPNAEGDFKELFLKTYPGSLKEGLETDLSAPREGCPGAQAGTAPAISPDTIIEIQEVKFGMGCAFEKQTYWVHVKWRALTAMNKRVLGETETLCFQTSFWEVDDWFADPERARAEIDGMLNMVGKRMAGLLLSEGESPVCQLQSNKNGEIEVKR